MDGLIHPSSAFGGDAVVEVLLGGCAVRAATVRDYDINSKIRARQSTRNHHGYNRYSVTHGIGRSARAASGPALSFRPRDPPTPP